VTTSTAAAEAVLSQFEAAWRDDTPVFGCCRKAVASAVTDNMDLLDLATREVTDRVQSLRAAVEAEMPGHLEAHRCCAGHLADLAFDLPSMFAEASLAGES
jgi:hypothetical protein